MHSNMHIHRNSKYSIWVEAGSQHSPLQNKSGYGHHTDCYQDPIPLSMTSVVNKEYYCCSGKRLIGG